MGNEATSADELKRTLPPAEFEAARDAGAQWAGYVILRLPHAVAPLVEDWLERHYPDRKDKVLNRIRAVRSGKLYDSEWRTRMRGEGIFADQIEAIFDASCRKFGLTDRRRPMSSEHFRRPGSQLDGVARPERHLRRPEEAIHERLEVAAVRADDDVVQRGRVAVATRVGPLRLLSGHDLPGGWRPRGPPRRGGRDRTRA